MSAGPKGRRSELDDSGEDVSRLRGLSDGIFGVALTLLVLDIRLPATSGLNAPLAQELLRLWPKLLAYALTFSVVGAYWLAHHRMLYHVIRYDRRLLWLNMLFLALVVLVPFPTTLLGLGAPTHPDAQTAWIAYASNIALIGLSLFWLWRYADRRGLVSEKLTIRLSQYLATRSIATPLVFLLSIGICLANVQAAYFTTLLIIPVNALVYRHYAYLHAS